MFSDHTAPVETLLRNWVEFPRLVSLAENREHGYRDFPEIDRSALKPSSNIIGRMETQSTLDTFQDTFQIITKSVLRG